MTLLLASCASAPADHCEAANREVSFGTLISNSFGDRYEKCLNNIRHDLRALSIQSTLFEAEADRLQERSKSLKGEEKQINELMIELNRYQAKITAKMSQSKWRQGADENQLRAILLKRQALEAKMTQDEISLKELKTLKREIQSLERSVMRDGVSG